MGILDSLRRNSLESKRSRPKLIIPFSRTEIIGEIIAAIILVAGQTYLAFTWGQIPDRIPSHYNFAGNPDNWSGKETLLILSVVTIFLYALLSLLRRFPHVYNYPVPINDSNAAKQYLYARTMITVLKAELVCLMSFIQWQTIQVALGGATGLDPAFMIGVMAAILITTLVYFISAYRAK
jgi:uncharacterized membrane protein